MQGPKVSPDKQNTARKAQGHLSKPNANPKASVDTVLDKVEEAQKHGALSKALQNEYNNLIQNADGRVFVDPKSGMLLIVKKHQTSRRSNRTQSFR